MPAQYPNPTHAQYGERPQVALQRMFDVLNWSTNWLAEQEQQQLACQQSKNVIITEAV